MKIKDYKCKCGHNDFFFADKGNQKGIYCTNCGKWLKWADKDEQNLSMRQETSRKVGKWIKSNIGGAKVCSICQAHMGLSNFKYCPNCGAKMEGEE